MNINEKYVLLYVSAFKQTLSIKPQADIVNKTSYFIKTTCFLCYKYFKILNLKEINFLVAACLPFASH